MEQIHISQARRIFDSHRPISIKAWRADGSILELDNCTALRYDMRTGCRNFKIAANGQIRRVRDCCIFQVNDIEVYI